MVVKLFVDRGLLNQYVAAIAACLSMLASGSCYGWITPILTYLVSEESSITVTTTQLSWVVYIIEFGSLLSPIPAGVLSDYIGRKYIILSTGPVYIIGWLFILYFPSPVMLIIARTIHGISMGASFTVVSVYVGEISANSSRGAISSLFYNSWWVGYLIAYSVGPLLSFRNFTYFTLAINIPFILLFFWQPESPYYYLLVKDDKRALKSLQWFRDEPTEDLEHEMEEMKQNVEESETSVGFKSFITNPVDRKAMLLLFILTTARLMSGSAAITVYATQIFEMTPNLPISPDDVTIALGIVLLVGGCIGTVTTDTLGRRPLIIISCVGSLFCQLGATVYYFLLTNGSVDVSKHSWVAPVLIFSYSGLCTAGMFPVCSSYISELFSSNTRGVASSICSLIITVLSFLALFIYQPLLDYFGLYANFLVYTLVIAFSTVYLYIVAPETRNKPFIQIRQELSK